MLTKFGLYDRVMMKKSHACGENNWQIVRTGADIKIKCLKCGRIVMLDRQDFIRMGKKILEKALEATNEQAN